MGDIFGLSKGFGGSGRTVHKYLYRYWTPDHGWVRIYPGDALTSPGAKKWGTAAKATTTPVREHPITATPSGEHLHLSSPSGLSEHVHMGAYTESTPSVRDKTHVDIARKLAGKEPTTPHIEGVKNILESHEKNLVPSLSEEGEEPGGIPDYSRLSTADGDLLILRAMERFSQKFVDSHDLRLHVARELAKALKHPDIVRDSLHSPELREAEKLLPGGVASTAEDAAHLWVLDFLYGAEKNTSTIASVIRDVLSNATKPDAEESTLDCAKRVLSRMYRVTQLFLEKAGVEESLLLAGGRKGIVEKSILDAAYAAHSGGVQVASSTHEFLVPPADIFSLNPEYAFLHPELEGDAKNSPPEIASNPSEGTLVLLGAYPKEEILSLPVTGFGTLDTLEVRVRGGEVILAWVSGSDAKGWKTSLSTLKDSFVY